MKRLSLTPFEILVPYLGLIEPKIAIACSKSNGRYSAEDILSSIRDNSMQIWLAFKGESLDGFVLTQILSYPQARVARLMCAMGIEIDGPEAFVEEIRDWLPFIKNVEDWAKSLGCPLMQIEAPLGWEFYVRGLGYGNEHVLFSKGLTA